MTMLYFFICLIGAMIGAFIGPFFAIGFSAATGWSEVGYFLGNLFFSVGGALTGMLFARFIHGLERIRLIEVVLPAFLGLVLGIISYAWVNRLIANSDYPL